MFPLARLCAVLACELTLASPASPDPASQRELAAYERAQDRVAAFSLAVCALRESSDRHGSRHPDTLRALQDAGIHAHLGGNEVLAVELLERAVGAWSEMETPPAEMLAEALCRLGSAYRHMGRRPQAWSCYERALDALRAAGGEGGVLWAEILEMRAHWLRGESNARALPALFEAAAAQRAAGGSPRLALAKVLTWLGWTLVQEGELERALPHLREAEDMLHGLGLGEHELMAVILERRATLAAVAGDFETAARLFGRAGELLERLRVDFPPGFSRRRCPLDVFTRQAWALAELGRGEQAWLAMQRAKANSAEEFLLLAEWRVRDPRGHAAIEELRRRYLALLPADDGVAPWDALLERLDVLARMQEAERGYLAMQCVAQPTPDELARHLDADTAYVGDLEVRIGVDPQSPQRLLRAVRWGYVLRKDAPLTWVRLHEARDPATDAESSGVRRELNALILRASEWPYRVESDARFDQLARQAGEICFDPLEPLLEGVERLVHEGGGVLLPLGVLRGGDGRYLDERFVISSTPSAGAFLSLRRDEPFELAPCLVLGTTVLSEAGGALPYARLEAEAIASSAPHGALGVDRERGAEEILELALSDGLARYRLIHVVGHGQSDPSPARNGFLLAARAPRRAVVRLEAETILNSWRLDQPLVVLSGCQTARGAGGARGESLGLLQAMFGVGARCVLASQWNVDDRATALLMSEFYRRVTERPGTERGTRALAAALSGAKRWLAELEGADGRRPFAHPVYWSGFELIGSSD